MLRKFLLLFVGAILSAMPSTAEDNPCLVPADKISTECVEYLLAMAEQGDAEAQFNLGWLYTSGVGLAEDKRSAAYWWLAAAEQGYTEAQTLLGMMYVMGEGVIQDEREGYIWFLIAKADGDELASKFVIANENKISPKEIKSAKREASKRWLKIEARRNRK